MQCRPRLLWGSTPEPALCHWAEEASVQGARGAGNNSNAPLTPRWIQISERRGLQETPLIPSLEDRCVDPIDVELPHCQRNTHRTGDILLHAVWGPVQILSETHLKYISNTEEQWSLAHGHFSVQDTMPASTRYCQIVLIKIKLHCLFSFTGITFKTGHQPHKSQVIVTYQVVNLNLKEENNVERIGAIQVTNSALEHYIVCLSSGV